MSLSISFSKGRKLFAGMDQPEPANKALETFLALELKQGKDGFPDLLLLLTRFSPVQSQLTQQSQQSQFHG